MYWSESYWFGKRQILALHHRQLEKQQSGDFVKISWFIFHNMSLKQEALGLVWWCTWRRTQVRWLQLGPQAIVLDTIGLGPACSHSTCIVYLNCCCSTGAWHLFILSGFQKYRLHNPGSYPPLQSILWTMLLQGQLHISLYYSRYSRPGIILEELASAKWDIVSSMQTKALFEGKTE